MVGSELALQPLNHAVCSGSLGQKCATNSWALAYKADRWLWLAVGDAPTSQPHDGWVGASDRQPSHEAPIPSVDGSGLKEEKGISHVLPCSLLPYAPPKRTVLRSCTQ